ncbi:hypothetical protein WR25_06893 [Diploscapter pachys]|uniref:Nitrogen permease regulator 2-like protein n=1 Tax=Diploscapter pachys TaxID=2018661 RepID=A0A2A2L3Z9_9BILA|nr:hypothetical protein WR25_06893 [Diploscapter pachys]
MSVSSDTSTACSSTATCSSVVTAHSPAINLSDEGPSSPSIQRIEDRASDPNECTGRLLGDYQYTDIPNIASIFFAEFDEHKGPVMKFQVPYPVISEEQFSSISNAIIPKPEILCRLIKIILEDCKIIGYPFGLICQKKDLYPRLKRYFNVCFVVPKTDGDDQMYEPLVQKCAEYFIELEQECYYLSDEKYKQKIPHMLKCIYEEINRKKECIYQATDITKIYLKLCPSYRGIEPPKVTPYVVPIFTREIEDNSFIQKMDVLSQKIIPKINGISCVKDIANETEIDTDLVSRCIRNLHFYECVGLVPIFLYSNTYVATEELHNFYHNKELKQECLEFVQRRNSKNQPTGELPTFSDIFRLYMSMRCGVSMHDWVTEQNPSQFNIDERRLVQFGMHYKFLRKLSSHPVAYTASPDQKDINNRVLQKFISSCDGTHSLEDLVLEFGAALRCYNPDQLHTLLVNAGYFEFISK